MLDVEVEGEGEGEVGSRRSWLMVVLMLSQGLLSEED